MNGRGTIRLQVDGRTVEVRAGSNVAAAIAQATLKFRRSRNGQPRAPLCGMGICFECRVNVDGAGPLRACMLPARDGMQVRTDG